MSAVSNEEGPGADAPGPSRIRYEPARLALAAVSAVIGGYGVLSADNLLQTILASNVGTFLVYGMTNAIVLLAFWHRAERNAVKHIVVPV